MSKTNHNSFGTLVTAVCVSGWLAAGSFAVAAPNSSTSSPEQKTVDGATAYGQLPLAFEPNLGQTDAQVKFLCHGAGYTLFMTEGESVLSLGRSSAASNKAATRAGAANAKSLEVLRFSLTGAQAHPKMEGVDPLTSKSNYLIGNEPSQWRTNIQQYAKVKATAVYPGINLVYYGNQGKLEYDFQVAPGADPRLIRFSVAGAEKIDLDAKGNLVLHAQGGDVTEQAPVIYQEIDGKRQAVAGNYEVHSLQSEKTKSKISEVCFQVASYDHSKPLIIDPVLFYSTYLGGNFQDQANAVAVDSAGNAYLTGYTSSTNFPTTAGAFQKTLSAGAANNVFVTKLNAAGSAPVYSTYLGGNGFDSGNAIAVDTAGDAFVAGSTGSSNFPTTAGAFQTVMHGAISTNAFVTKLNPAGSALLYSTYLGGTGANGDSGNGIAIDTAGNAYVAGDTDSTDFPTTSGVFQPALGGLNAQNGFITKLNATGTGLLYSTFLGGSIFDAASAIAIDSSGKAYVTGNVTSANFPTTPGAFQSTVGMSGNAFVSKLNAGATALVYSTYLGGSGGDTGNGIAVDTAGNAYVAGNSSSTNFPTTAGAFQTVYGGGEDAFVTKLNASGSAPIYSTYLGGNDTEQGHGIALDKAGRAYVTGQTSSANFPTMNPVQATLGSVSVSSNAFLTKLNAAGSALIYSSYFGGTTLDIAYGIAADNAGNAYIAGDTESTDMPTTSGAFQTSAPSIPNAFVAKTNTTVKNDFNSDGKPDLVWQNTSNGQIQTWFMNGPTLISSQAFSISKVTDTNWQIVGTGDFNGDGQPDLVWQNNSTGQIQVWNMNGTQYLSSQAFSIPKVTDTHWKIAGVADFNGDGKPDLVWQNNSSGQIQVWFMNGATFISSQPFSVPKVTDTNWKIVGTGDFNGDGKPDLIWQNNATGYFQAWLMNGATLISSQSFSIPKVTPTTWKIAGSGDFNFDGKSDLIWQNNLTGQIQVWYLNGLTFLSSQSFSVPQVTDTNWKIRNR